MYKLINEIPKYFRIQNTWRCISGRSWRIEEEFTSFKWRERIHRKSHQSSFKSLKGTIIIIIIITIQPKVKVSCPVGYVTLSSRVELRPLARMCKEAYKKPRQKFKWPYNLKNKWHVHFTMIPFNIYLSKNAGAFVISHHFVHFIYCRSTHVNSEIKPRMNIKFQGYRRESEMYLIKGRDT